MKETEQISREVRADNSDNANRSLDVQAIVTIASGRIASIRDGSVRNGGGVVIATFHGHGSSVNINFSAADHRAEVLDAVESFLAVSTGADSAETPAE